MPAFVEHFQHLLPWAPPPLLADMLPWLRQVRTSTGETVILCKDGYSLLRAYRVQGCDLTGKSKEEIGGHLVGANDALKRLDGEWTLHAEMQRTPVTSLPDRPAGHPLAQALYADQRQRLLHLPTCTHAACTGCHARENAYYIVLTWKPTETYYDNVVDMFCQAADDHMFHLGSLLAECEPLSAPELLYGLHTTVSDTWHPVAPPLLSTALDLFLCNTAYDEGEWPDWDATLGEWHLRVLTLTGYPQRSWGTMLEPLYALPLDMRWGIRWAAISRHLQEGILQQKAHAWHGKQRTVFQWFQQVWGWSSQWQDDAALHMANDMRTAQDEMQYGDVYGLGKFTTALMVWGHSAEEANHNSRLAQQALQGQGLMCRQEGMYKERNPQHQAAWLGAQWGNTVDNIRNTVQHTMSLTHLMPGILTSHSGPIRDPHLGTLPWLYALTETATLYRIVNHVRDLGHFLVVGPYGSGKTSFTNLLRIFWMLEAMRQCVLFDMKKGGRLATLLLGGRWYDLGQLTFQIQPLRDLDTPHDKGVAIQWVFDLLAQYKVPLGPVEMRYVTSNMDRLATKSPALRTITALVASMADHTRPIEQRGKHPDMVERHNAVLGVLQNFTTRGTYGHIFDSDEDTLVLGDVLTFELEGLLAQAAVRGPILRHLYPKVYRRMSTERPMLLINDDAAIPWAVDQIQKQTDDWLRLVRDKSVSMGFLTQSPRDVVHLPIFTMLLDIPQRFFLSNRAALGGETAREYQRLNLSPTAVERIATLTPRHDIYRSCPEQEDRVFHLPLSKFALDCCARNSAQDHHDMDTILAREGPEGFAAGWCRHHGHTAIAHTLQERDHDAPHAV